MITLIPISQTRCRTSDVKDAEYHHVSDPAIIERSTLCIIFDKNKFKIVKSRTLKGIDEVKEITVLPAYVEAQMKEEIERID